MPVEPAPAVDEAIRSRLALVLDVDDLVVAVRLARELRPWFGVAKIGLELYAAAGPDAIGALMDNGYDVFVDLKLLDIPTTVGRASRVLGLARRALPDDARPRRRRHAAGRGRGVPGGRRRSPGCPTRIRWRSRC